MAGLGLALGGGAAAGAATLGDILKQKFLEQLQKQKLAEDIRQANMQHQVQQAQLGQGQQRINLDTNKFGEEQRQFGVTSGQTAQRIGFEGERLGLDKAAAPSQTALRVAQTEDLNRQPQEAIDTRAFREKELGIEHGNRMGEIGAQGANALRVANVKTDAQTHTELTPAAIDQAAHMYLMTGTMPALGMGAAGTRIAIMNRAGEIDPKRSTALSKANYTADSASQRNLQQTADTLSAFKHAAKANLSQFETLMAKLPDAGAPFLNTPLRAWNLQGLGNEQVAAAEAARQIALREVARVTNNPRLTGQLSDAARHEVENLIPANATIAQIRRVMPVLLQDMENVERETNAQLDAIRTRMKEGVPGNDQSPAPNAPPKTDIKTLRDKYKY